jgi:hypothetical protein
MRTFDLTLVPPPRPKPGHRGDHPDHVIWAKHGTPWNGSLKQLEALLATPIPAAAKFACGYFLIGAFRDHRPTAGAFQHASVIGLDIDHGLTIADVERALAPWAHIIYTTWQHTDASPRFRVVVPLARDTDAADTRKTWEFLNARLGGNVDPATKNLNRNLFLPAVRPDGVASTVRLHLDTPCLDPAEIPDPPTPPPRRRFAERAGEMPVIRVSMRNLSFALEIRLAEPTVRLGIAQDLGATLSGEGDRAYADHLACPRCARPSVWYWVSPQCSTHARCHHLKSCGWSGPLSELLIHVGGAA